MKLIAKFKKFFSIKNFKKLYKNSVVFIRKKPIISFIIALAALFLIILAGSILNAPQVSPASEAATKSVEVYKIGTAPRLTVQAKIEKSGVIKITALTGGVISAINVKEGDKVFQGTNLITLSSNYAGGNALALSAQIAQKQYQNILDTYQEQKDLIQRQRDLANSIDANAQDLRDIADKSLNETHDLANLNQDILDTLNQNLNNYTATNSAGINDAVILQTKQLKSQFQSALNALNQASRSAQYQSSSSNPPADMTNEQKDIALKQLDVQEKALELNREISRLQTLIAQVNAAMMHPTSPFAGTVERIYVRRGMAVSPGMPLLLLSGNSDRANALALVSENIAKKVSQLETSTLTFGEQFYEEHPFHISSEATDGQLYSIDFAVPDKFIKDVSDGSYISVSIPIGFPDTGGAIPFVPLDAVYQSQNQAYLFIVKNNKASSANITLGQVYGSFVEIKSGLKSGDQVILNRNIVAGDLVNPSY